ncbi:HAD family hydrolase [Konateibacter massiliensis]|uniref:HAD family hydrolase n=1 Tax=Konateibacter massiliensis TaxID=2002841 RepID=UPI001F2BED20|nr:HAD family phosphatase [Konateibacter massiliensis]
MNKLKNVQGIIFDMDGTLIDSMPMWENIASEYLKIKGFTPEENLGAILKKMSLRQGTEYVIDTYCIKETTEKIIEGINKLVIEKYEKELPAKEGVVELIRRLAEKKVAMCVATASDYEVAKLCLERIGVFNYLKGVYTCDHIGAGKDEPAIFEHALRELGTQKENTYVFEDSLHALETAKNAGFKVVGVYDEASGDEEERIRQRSDFYITTMAELL